MLSIDRWHVHFDAQSGDGVLAKHRDVLQHLGVHLLLALLRPVALLVPPLLLPVHLREQVGLDDAQRGGQHVKAPLHGVAQGGAHAERRGRQVGHRFAHHAQGLDEVQGALPGGGWGMVLVLVVLVVVLGVPLGQRQGRGGLLMRMLVLMLMLGVVDEVPRAVAEVAGGAAQREQRQVQVARRLGEGVEEQPQLQHRVACGD